MPGGNVEFLGTDAPHSGIIDAVRTQHSDLLCISATMLFNVPNVVKLIRDLRNSSPKLGVLIGGAAFRRKPEFWMDIGADGFAPDLNSGRSCRSASVQLVEPPLPDGRSSVTGVRTALAFVPVSGFAAPHPGGKDRRRYVAPASAVSVRAQISSGDPAARTGTSSPRFR